MPIQHVSVITGEIIGVMVTAAIVGTIGHESGISPSMIRSAWCLVGGCLGAYCSLHFFRIKQSKHLYEDIRWQFGVNLALSYMFTPLAVYYLGLKTGLPDELILLPCAGALGLSSQKVVGWIISYCRMRAAKIEKRIDQRLGVEVETPGG